MSDKLVYSVYQGNLACPMSSLVPENFVKLIENVEGVDMVSPEIRQNMVLIDELVKTIMGIYPERFQCFKNINVSPGAWETFIKDTQSVLLGKDLARELNNKYGRLDNNYRIPLKIAGIFDFPLSALNNMIITHKNYLNRYAFKGENVTVINILFDPKYEHLTIVKNIETELKKYQPDIVCRPETAIWERAQTGMAQFGKYIYWYGIIVAIFTLFFYMNFSFNFIKKNANHESEFIVHNKIKSIFSFRILYLSINFFAAVITGSTFAFIIFISRPIITGVDIFHPPVLVNFHVMIESIIILFIFGLAGCLSGIKLHKMLITNKLTNKTVFGLCLVPTIIIIFAFNLLLSYPIKLKSIIMNGAESDNVIISQHGITTRIMQASNIPTTLLDICHIASNIKTVNGRKLISPVIQLPVAVGNKNIIFLGVDLSTFFQIKNNIRVIKGEQTIKEFELLAGKNLNLNESIEYEGTTWKIKGIFKSGSFYDNFILTDIKTLANVTGRETLQYIILKMEDIEDYKILEKEIQKYYGIQLTEIPELPSISVATEINQVTKTAKNFNGLFILNGILVLIAIIISIILFITFFKLLISSFRKARKKFFVKILVFTGIISFISGIFIYWIGGFFSLTFAFSRINLRPIPLLIMVSFFVTITVAYCCVHLTNKFYVHYNLNYKEEEKL